MEGITETVDLCSTRPEEEKHWPEQEEVQTENKG